MAIRLRKVKTDSHNKLWAWKWVALCAAEHSYKKGDIYIDDAKHEALYDKFDRDIQMEGLNGKA